MSNNHTLILPHFEQSWIQRHLAQKNISRFEQIGLNRLEHFPNRRERMPIFLDLSRII
jgi:hypothetical protein